MKTRLYATVLTALLILIAGSAMCTATYDPIADNGMKAYVWNSNEATLWGPLADGVACTLTEQGFEVIRHTNPPRDLVYQTISDPDVKVYYGIGHGSDYDCYTGIENCRATAFGDIINDRGTPLSIGFFRHCGEYLCYTPGRWLQESTQGNDDVVAKRSYGTGWCGDTYGVGGSHVEKSLLERMGFGYTFEDAARSDEGRKQGNRDLRYPQFCGDVDYDKVVDSDDVALLQNHTIDPVTYPIHSDWDGDVDGDGSVNIYDANLLADHVSDPSAYPLSPRGWFRDCNPWDDDGIIEVGEIMEAITLWENQQAPYPGCPIVTASDIMDLITIWQNQ